MRLGLLPLARQTFDVLYAKEKLGAMLAVLDASGHEIVGPRELLFDEPATRAAIVDLQAACVDQILVLQVTFTDAAMSVLAGDSFDQPLVLWAVLEPRTGGRLRLNAFCGLNLASHALGLNKRAFSWLYADPADDVAGELDAALSGQRRVRAVLPTPPPDSTATGRAIATAVSGRRIGRIGAHPAGFDTCAYDADTLRALAGVEVDVLSLETLFDTARAIPAAQAGDLRARLEQLATGLDALDQDQLNRSLRLKAALEVLRDRGRYDAFAIRCWPETFTDYGGAVCGPAAMMGEGGVPCACEADVYGALTQLVLQEAAQSPVFLADLVDVDTADDTGVLWHCGQAPLSMQSPATPAGATVHTNRKQPLLFQFALKPGEVTLLRVSQAMGQPRLVLGFGQMLARPMAYTGTSGVIRFARPAGQVLQSIIDSGLEHHMALAYGDYRVQLRGVAGALGLPLLEI